MNVLSSSASDATNATDAASDARHSGLDASNSTSSSLLPNSTSSSLMRRLAEQGEDAGGMLRRRGRMLAGSSGRIETDVIGRHVSVRIQKHVGSLNFMTLVGDHPPMKLVPPYRVMQYADLEDEAVFCSLDPGQAYWLAFSGGTSCAVYDLLVEELAANDTRCANGDARLESNGELSGGSQQLPLEHFMYGSA